MIATTDKLIGSVLQERGHKNQNWTMSLSREGNIGLFARPEKRGCPAIWNSCIACNSNISLIFNGRVPIYMTNYICKGTQEEAALPKTKGAAVATNQEKDNQVEHLSSSAFPDSCESWVGSFSACSHNPQNTKPNMKLIQQPDILSKNMPLFNEEYDEEEDILLCGLPYPLFGPRKKHEIIEKNFCAGLQKNDGGFAIRRMNEKDMLAGIQQKREKK